MMKLQDGGRRLSYRDSVRLSVLYSDSWPECWSRYFHCGSLREFIALFFDRVRCGRWSGLGKVTCGWSRSGIKLTSSAAQPNSSITSLITHDHVLVARLNRSAITLKWTVQLLPFLFTLVQPVYNHQMNWMATTSSGWFPQSTAVSLDATRRFVLWREDRLGLESYRMFQEKAGYSLEGEYGLIGNAPQSFTRLSLPLFTCPCYHSGLLSLDQSNPPSTIQSVYISYVFKHKLTPSWISHRLLARSKFTSMVSKND